MNKLSVYVFGLAGVLFINLLVVGCSEPEKDKNDEPSALSMQDRVDQYITVELKTDMSKLNDKQKKIIGLLIDAAKAMDKIYWKEAYGNKNELLNQIDDEATKTFVKINYGPWDRLNDNKPFIDVLVLIQRAPIFTPLI